MENKEFDYKQVQEDGCSISADVYYPSPSVGGGSSPRAIAILFHGGGFVVGSKEMVSMDEIETLVLEFGFVAVVPNYRLCPTVSLYDGPVQDARDCYTWAETKLPGLLIECGLSAVSNKIVTIGFSAGGTLALLMANMPRRPAAILAFYAASCFEDSFWHNPLLSLANIPEFSKDFLAEIFQESTAVATPSALAGKEVSPRNAWLLSGLKEGWWLEKIVQDGNYDRVDPSKLYSKTFPPTCFVHGSTDALVDPKFSEAGHDLLKNLGVDTEYLLVDGKGHDFDSKISKDSAEFEPVRTAFAFAERRIS